MKYGELRYWLFTKSYICSKLVEHLRIKYGLSIKLKNNEWQDKIIHEKWDLLKNTIFFKHFYDIAESDKEERGLRLIYAIDEVSKNITPEITTLARELDMSETLFRVLVLYNNIPKKLAGRNIIKNAISEIESIDETGHYIKVDEYVSKQEVLRAYEEIQKQIKFYNEAQEEKKKGRKIIHKRKRKDIPNDDKEKTPIFCRIEKEIMLLSREKIESDDYQNQLVNESIRRVVGNSLDPDDEKFDLTLEKKTITYADWYRKIIKRYNLPTPTKLSSILRLISK